MALRIEFARREDVPLILDLIRELAEFEREPESAEATAGQIEAALFGERPAAEGVIAWVDSEAAGWALWFQNFSTWTGKAGLWLEDLYVRPRFRRQGVGKALLVYLARLSLERGYGRFEWPVLDWNTAAVEFYRAVGAEAMSEWTTQRLSGESLQRLADTQA